MDDFSQIMLIGRLAFKLIVFFHDRTTEAFIVEHDVDKAILQKFVRRPVLQLGSGLDTTGFSRKPKQYRERCSCYLSRFGKREVTKF